MMVSICVASVRSTTLPYLITSINAQTYRNWELIIAVQGNDPSLLSCVKQNAQHNPQISLISMQTYGKCHALNRAMNIAKGEIIALTDDDCVASPDWLSIITDCFLQEPSVGIVAGDLLPSPKHKLGISTCPATYTIEYIYRPSEEHYHAPHGFYFGGANLAIRRPIIDLVGFFDEYLGPGTEFPAAEDVDFALRAEALGVVMWTTPRSIIHHSYGRRFGVSNFLKHHRSYALGSGALQAKLKLWEHRLSNEWSFQSDFVNPVTYLAKNPARSLLEIYKNRFKKMAYSVYMSKFKLDEKILSRPK